MPSGNGERAVTVDLDQLAATLATALPGQVERNVAFGALTTWRVGGPAAIRIRIDAVGDGASVARSLPPDVPVVVFGRGSNLLVADTGFAGVVLTLGPTFDDVEIATGRVIAGAATALPILARRCAAAGQAGLGFFVGIPGSVGGAVRMNAGGHGRETREVLRAATVIDLTASGQVQRREPASLELGYRHSALGPMEIVVGAEFAVTAGSPDALREELTEVVRWRTEHQPGGANAGSVFRNPPGDSAARLIDQVCGLRGFRHGGAVVSEKHANFIQADPGATAADVHHLIAAVRDRVERETGVELDVEVHFLGFGPG